MLKNETYAGTRYFNRITRATDARPARGIQLIRSRWVYRDSSRGSGRQTETLQRKWAAPVAFAPKPRDQSLYE
jgi:hypothetical protein